MEFLLSELMEISEPSKCQNIYPLVFLHIPEDMNLR